MQTLTCVYTSTSKVSRFHFRGIHLDIKNWSAWVCLRYSQSLQVALLNLFNNNLPHHSSWQKTRNTLACQPRAQSKRTTNSSVRVASESDVFWIWINNRRILRRLLQHTGDMVTNNDLILSTSVPALGLTLFQLIILINLPITKISKASSLPE